MTSTALAATMAAVIFPAAMIFAGVMDVFTLKIRNALVIAIAAGYFVLAPAAGFSLSVIGWSTAIAVLVLAVAFTFFALGWIGGGDAKLAAATALWFGPDHALVYFIYTAILGGLLTLVVLQLRSRMLPASLYRFEWVCRLSETRSVPYGAAMAPAALIIFPQTEWMMHSIL